MKVVLVNDTFNAYHWGCTATSRALSRRIQEMGYEIDYVPIVEIYNAGVLPRNRQEFDDPEFFKAALKAEPSLFERLKSADIVVVNGEGTLHHLTKPAVKLLFIAWAAKKYLGKNVQIINHSAYPGTDPNDDNRQATALYTSIYRHLDYIAIREPISHQLMSRLGVDAQLSFDCLPLTVTEQYPRPVAKKSNYVVIADSVSFPPVLMPVLMDYIHTLRARKFQVVVLFGARNHYAADSLRFVEALRNFSAKDYDLVDAASLRSWLDCIGRARLLVSGRFHHSIAAAFLGTPFVLMESNTPKNQALAKIFKIAPPLSYNDAEFSSRLGECTAAALDSPPLSEELLMQLVTRAQINFSGLNKDA